MSAGNPHRVELTALPQCAAAISLLTHDPLTDLVSRKLHEERVWEPFETQLWLASHGPGSIVVDVGANLGYFCLLSARHEIPSGPIIAFEPAADNYALLCANLELNGCAHRVTPVRAALGEHSGAGILHRSAHNLGDHQLTADDGPREQEAVSVLCGDSYLSEHVTRIDLLKIDTQGSEHAVLRGLLPLLQRSRGGLRVLVELTPHSLRTAGSSGRQLVELLARLDLPLSIVDHVEHRLVRSDAEALGQWCDNVETTAGDRGFMNIFAGTPPPGF